LPECFRYAAEACLLTDAHCGPAVATLPFHGSDADETHVMAGHLGWSRQRKTADEMSAVEKLPDRSLRFEILGPLRAVRDGAELDLGPSKQRAVLAVLLMNANTSVPVAHILDAVWLADPPENGPNVVQKYVAGLRRVLEPDRSPRAKGTLLRRTDAGYLLEVQPGCLDADVFEQRVREAMALRAEGRDGAAAERLRSALGLWRGEALTGLPDLPGSLLDAARQRLAEHRAAALESWAEIELDLGHHSRIVADLIRLVAEFPIREQLRYLLILALYRCGRQAEALAAYREARTYLAEEFGVEPGERLQRLHLQILRSDPALLLDSAGPQAPHGGPAVPVPRIPPVAGMPPGTEPARDAGTTVAATRWPSWLPRAFAGAVPLVTFGFFSWAPFTYLALRRRSPLLALAAAGYFGVFVLAVILLGPETGPIQTVGLVGFLFAWLGGAAHAAALDPHRRAGSPRVPSDPAALAELSQRIHREQALRLLVSHPVIARELRIGRPDLPRDFDDGGLVDINEVPEEVLGGLPGMTQRQARLIVADRRHRGRYTSVNDLLSRGLLPEPVPREILERLIVVHPVHDGDRRHEPSALPAALPAHDLLADLPPTGTSRRH
jgi:DNA-binding SARP family transcriptional activator